MEKWGFMLIVWLVVAGGTSRAANPPIWDRGELILSDGTVLAGELAYNWKAEIVCYKQGDVVKAYSAQQVNSFKYFDRQQNSLRKFVTLHLPVKPTQHRPSLVEEYVSGPLMVYRRLRQPREILRLSRLIAYQTEADLIKDIDNFEYFVADGRAFINLVDFNRSLWPQMRENYRSTLQEYIARRSLDLNSTVARLMLINQYNYLTADDMPSAGSVSSGGQ